MRRCWGLLVGYLNRQNYAQRLVVVAGVNIIGMFLWACAFHVAGTFLRGADYQQRLHLGLFTVFEVGVLYDDYSS